MEGLAEALAGNFDAERRQRGLQDLTSKSGDKRNSADALYWEICDVVDQKKYEPSLDVEAAVDRILAREVVPMVGSVATAEAILDVA